MVYLLFKVFESLDIRSDSAAGVEEGLRVQWIYAFSGHCPQTSVPDSEPTEAISLISEPFSSLNPKPLLRNP